VPTHEVSYPAGTSIFEQGDQSDYVYTITSGDIEIVRVMADGVEEVLNELHPGQYFGELGAFLGFPRTASARSITDVVLTAYDPQVFRERVLTEH
jgi:CRP-like cAMP-binding protein